MQPINQPGAISSNSPSPSSSAPNSTVWVVVSWVLVLAWAALIFFMSAHTGSDLIEGDDFVAHIKQWLNEIQLRYLGPGVDLASSIAHFCEFTVFGALLANALGRHLKFQSAKNLQHQGQSQSQSQNQNQSQNQSQNQNWDQDQGQGQNQGQSPTHPKHRWLLIFVLAVVIASAYAVTDEVHQIFVPGRMCDPIDWMVDTAGAMLGAAIWLAATMLRTRRSKQFNN